MKNKNRYSFARFSIYVLAMTSIIFPRRLLTASATRHVSSNMLFGYTTSRQLHCRRLFIRGGSSSISWRNFRDDAKQKNQLPSNTTVKTETSSIGDKLQSEKQKRFQLLRQGAGGVLSGIGFVTSSIKSIIGNRGDYQKPLQSLQTFLKKSGVDLELERSLNRHLAVNLALLARVQMEGWKTRFRPPSVELNAAFWTEAKRYMRYATAVYGQAMIHAAEIDARGKFEFEHLGKVTRDSISTHIGVPAEDIRLLDVDYDGDSHHLRHFVAIDHENSKVVLAIRGTFNLQEVMVDVAAFSREFCGGEGHSEMATMAERVWKKASPTVSSLTKKHPSYDFVVTGHSLGAGTACLLTILVQSRNLVPKGTNTRCFAYAAPPVFSPPEFAPSLETTVNFIHGKDVVPFLSVFSIRHLLSRLQRIQGYVEETKMSRLDCLQVAVGWKPPSQELMDYLQQTNNMPKPIEGAPRLEIPAGKTIWLHEVRNGHYTWDCLSHEHLVQHFSRIKIHPDMLTDHFPPRYEHALEHMETDNVNKD